MNTYTNLKVGSLGASLALLLSAAAPAALAASAPQAGRTPPRNPHPHRPPPLRTHPRRRRNSPPVRGDRDGAQSGQPSFWTAAKPTDYRALLLLAHRSHSSQE